MDQASADLAAVLNAGSARGSDAIARALRDNADRFCASRTPDEAAAFIEAAVRDGARSLIVAGGDGTLAHALTCAWRAVDRDDDLLPAIGLLRLGTGNAAADAFEIPRASAAGVRDLAERLRRREVGEPLRTVRVDDQLGCFAGFGVDAQLLEDHRDTVDWLRARGLDRLASGALGYALSTATRSLPRFVLRQRPTVTAINVGQSPARAIHDGAIGPADIEAGARLWSGRCTLAACATIPTFGFGLRMFTRAEADRDRFQLRVADAGLLEIITNTRAAFRGDYDSPRVHDFLCDAATLEMSSPAPFELSGDLLGTRRAATVYLGPTFELLG